MYAVKEIYYTIQGEGFHSGRPAIFLRFSGCNLWSGLEKDRKTALCTFCDTDFWGTDGLNGGKYEAIQLVEKCKELWPAHSSVNPFVVCTGGEPLLQLDNKLITAFHESDFSIAIESNGTIAVPQNIDWLCISPKCGTELIVHEGDELKVVFPQKGINLSDYEDLNFTHHFLQPLDDHDQMKHILDCVDICKNNPKWKLSLQTHKFIDIP